MQQQEKLLEWESDLDEICKRQRRSTCYSFQSVQWRKTFRRMKNPNLCAMGTGACCEKISKCNCRSVCKKATGRGNIGKKYGWRRWNMDNMESRMFSLTEWSTKWERKTAEIYMRKSPRTCKSHESKRTHRTGQTSTKGRTLTGISTLTYKTVI